MRRIRPFELTCKHCSRAFEPLKWKGYEQQFCSGTCRNLARHKGSIWLDKSGYPQMTVTGRGQVAVHREVMERKLGRRLEPWETVHHKDGNRANYAEDNLELWSSRHGRGQRASDLITDQIGISSGILSMAA